MPMNSKADYILATLARHKLLAGLVLIVGSLMFWAMTPLLPIFLMMAFISGILLISFSFIRTFGLNIVSGILISILVIFALISIYMTDMFAISVANASIASVGSGILGFLILLIGILLTLLYIYLQD